MTNNGHRPAAMGGLATIARKRLEEAPAAPPAERTRIRKAALIDLAIEVLRIDADLVALEIEKGLREDVPARHAVSGMDLSARIRELGADRAVSKRDRASWKGVL